MLRNIDYQRVFNIIDIVSEMPDSIALSSILSNSFESLDFKSKVQNSALYTWICTQKKLKAYLSEPDDHQIDLDIYLILYTHVVLKETFTNLESLNNIDHFLLSGNLNTSKRSILREFQFTISAYLIRTGVTSWKKLSDGSDLGDWTSINLLSNLLPLSKLSIDEFDTWITEIIKKNERDMALPSIGRSVKEWATYSTEDTKNFEDQIPNILDNKFSKQYLPAIMQGLRERQGRDLQYYVELFAENASVDSMFDILHSIGSTLSQENSERFEYFNYITEKRNSGRLNNQSFIRLCSIFGYHSNEVLDYITSVLTLNNFEIYLAVVDLLYHNAKKLNLEWYENTLATIIIVGSDDLTAWQRSILSDVIEKNITFAFELLNKRIDKLGEKYLLEDNLRDGAEKNPDLFRTYFVSWIHSDNPLAHRAVLHISALTMNESIFKIPEQVFQKYSKNELIYIGGKMVGYIYSQKPLQHSLLSLIKSIKNKDDRVFQNFKFILSEYLVYNYRSTLNLIKEELKNKSLNKFAKSIFRSTIKEYEAYFKELDGIAELKEIRSSSRLVQLRRFYVQKQFGELPKEKSSFLNFIKETKINSHRWAIRRPGVFKHEISNMGKISYETEFPSGEILCPVHQESIRREMQLLKKDEINID